MSLIAFGDLSRNLERLYAVCVCRKTLNPEERETRVTLCAGELKFVDGSGLVNSAALIQRFDPETTLNKLNTSNLQQFRIKNGASLVTIFRGHYITSVAFTLEHGNGQEKENNQTKTGAPEIAHAAAVKFARRRNAFRFARHL